MCCHGDELPRELNGFDREAPPLGPPPALPPLKDTPPATSAAELPLTSGPADVPATPPALSFAPPRRPCEDLPDLLGVADLGGEGECRLGGARFRFGASPLPTEVTLSLRLRLGTASSSSSPGHSMGSQTGDPADGPLSAAETPGPIAADVAPTGAS